MSDGATDGVARKKSEEEHTDCGVSFRHHLFVGDAGKRLHSGSTLTPSDAVRPLFELEVSPRELYFLSGLSRAILTSVSYAAQVYG